MGQFKGKYVDCLGERLIIAASLAIVGMAVLAIAATRLCGWRLRAQNQEIVRLHLENVATQPSERFLRDLANLVSGTVTGPSGRPVAGAQVEVFSKSILLQALGMGEVPLPEATLWTNQDGEFSVGGLPYGNKYIRARADGLMEHVLEDVVSIDGAGAQRNSLSLNAASDWNVVLTHADGSPASDVQVRLVPQGLLEVPRLARSDSSGQLFISRSLRGESESGVWLLIGKPAVSVLVDRNTKTVALPAAVDLPIKLSGLRVGEPALLWLIPTGAPSLGAFSMEVDSVATELNLTLQQVWTGDYGVAALQEHKASWVDIAHDGRAVSCHLRPRGGARIQFVDAMGEPVESTVAWRWQPSRPSGPIIAAADRRVLLDQWDPLMRSGVTDARGGVVIDNVVSSTGWLSAHSDKHGSILVALEGSDTLIRLDGVPVSIRTRLPFLPIQVESADGRLATYEADRFAEVRISLNPGPYVVRSRFSGGLLSYPQGLWAGGGGGSPSFTPADSPGANSGYTIYGFVCRQGVPVAGAQVFLDLERARKTETNEHGFYRFVGVLDSVVRVSACESAALDAVLLPVLVSGGADRVECRMDIEIGSSSILIEGLPHGMEGERIVLFRCLPSDDEAGTPSGKQGLHGDERAVFLKGLRVVDGGIKATGLFSGTYELRLGDPAVEPWSLRIELGESDEFVLRANE
jgi:carboxypeptidase family protein